LLDSSHYRSALTFITNITFASLTSPFKQAMEFEIDTQLVSRIVADELSTARGEVQSLGPVAALGRSQVRHDARLAAAGDAHTLACRGGCFWCCYFTVEVRPIEVIRIHDFLRHEMSEPDRSRIQQEITTNAAVLASMDEETRLRHNMKCPFLHLGRCSIYSVRPQTCRNYHATDAAGCERAYHEPENDDIDPEFAPLVYQSGGAHVDAFSTAMKEAGYEVAAYELNTALAAALAEPASMLARFEAKTTTFPALESVDVEPEFIDT
jgi:Fe-S-cluster containining protein